MALILRHRTIIAKTLRQENVVVDFLIKSTENFGRSQNIKFSISFYRLFFFHPHKAIKLYHHGLEDVFSAEAFCLFL